METAALASWPVRLRSFVMICKAFSKALVSKHTSRPAAMHGAEREISERRDVFMRLDAAAPAVPAGGDHPRGARHGAGLRGGAIRGRTRPREAARRARRPARAGLAARNPRLAIARPFFPRRACRTRPVPLPAFGEHCRAGGITCAELAPARCGQGRACRSPMAARTAQPGASCRRPSPKRPPRPGPDGLRRSDHAAGGTASVADRAGRRARPFSRRWAGSG